MDMVFGDNLGQKDQERMREIMHEFGIESEDGSDARIGKIAVQGDILKKPDVKVVGDEKTDA